MPLPWRPEHGRVVQMFSTITWPDGTPFECDTRGLLKKAIEKAGEAGFEFNFGAEQEFYLFELDENGKPTAVPCDEAGYMDIAPEDHGEMYGGRSVSPWKRWGSGRRALTTRKGPGKMRSIFVMRMLCPRQTRRRRSRESSRR